MAASVDAGIDVVDFAHAQPPHRHSVKCQRAGFVRTQNGCRTEGFNRRHAPGEDPLLRHAPRPKREKYGKNDGNLFRQERHR